MDAVLRAAEQAHRADPTAANQEALDRARRRAGWVERYVGCTRCNPQTRCVRSHGQAVLCGECGGQGWTDIVLVPPESEQERYKNPPPPSWRR